MQETQMMQKEKENDIDRHLAQTIMDKKLYSTSSQADDEYEFDKTPLENSKKRRADHMLGKIMAKRIVTQQERCLFCFESPNRPKHLVVAIANFTYLMLPQFEPVVPGHCCILTVQVLSAAL